MSKLSQFLHHLTNTAAPTPPPAEDAKVIQHTSSLFEQLKNIADHQLSPAGKKWLDDQIAAHLGPFSIVAEPLVHRLEDTAIAKIEEVIHPKLDALEEELRHRLGAHADDIVTRVTEVIEAAFGARPSADDIAKHVVAALPPAVPPAPEISGAGIDEIKLAAGAQPKSK